MIKCKQDYYDYLEADRARMTTPVCFRDFIFKTEKYYIWKYIKCLRRTEYINNTQRGVLRKILYAFYLRWLLKLQRQTQLFVPPNVFGPGLFIPHLGRILISPIAEIGSNCTIRPGLLIGANFGGVINPKVQKTIIGDNVEFAEGCKILCRKIGSNVRVAPNTVILKNIPENSVVYGNPCEIIPMDV